MPSAKRIIARAEGVVKPSQAARAPGGAGALDTETGPSLAAGGSRQELAERDYFGKGRLVEPPGSLDELSSEIAEVCDRFAELILKRHYSG
jgi:hypothetical protein